MTSEFFVTRQWNFLMACVLLQLLSHLHPLLLYQQLLLQALQIFHCSDTSTVTPTATQSSIPSAQLSLQSVIAATPSSCSPKSTNSHSLEVNKLFSFISDEELSLLSKGVNIVNTTKATSLAVKFLKTGGVRQSCLKKT